MKNNTNDIIVTQNEQGQYNLDIDQALLNGIDDSVLELLTQLRAANDPLYPEVSKLINKEISLNDLSALLFLTQTVFTNFSFRLDFDENKWQEVGSSLSRLRKMYPIYNDIINLYIEHVDLTNINTALKPKDIVEVDKQIRTYFKMSA